MFEFLDYSFMLRAFFAGTAVAIILGWLGTFVVTRKISFIGDGLAHASLAGIALAILAGLAPLPTALIIAVLIAIIIYFLEKKANISGDMAIALMFTTGLAIGIILLHYYQGYQPELISYLFGNILSISVYDLKFILVASLIIIITLSLFYRQILFVTFDPIGAHLSGLKPWFYDLLLYVMTAVAIILSIKLVGIILVSALLVTPSAISRLFANSYKHFTIGAILLAVIIVFVGLVASYYLDWPSGATIILVGTLFFVLASIAKSLISSACKSSAKLKNN